MYAARFSFHSDYGDCNLDVLEQFEASVLKTQLPDSYRSFLLQWNGGRFAEFVNFPFQDSEDDLDYGYVLHFSGLFEEANQLDLRNMSNSYGFRSAVPANYIVIGDNHSWNLLCVSVEGRDRGSIYYWDPGEPWINEPSPTTRFLRPVADDFEEFWQVLFRADDC